jgi:5-formyltetrahydrofolate cyclo-ligase
LARLAPAAALAPGRHGIPEPVAPDWTHPEIIELAIIPGLAFDRRGDRLGHGAGHYDRLLAQAPLKSALKIGLAFAFQLREFVPATARDVAMDGVVTEAEIIWSRTAKKATKVEGRKSKVGSALDL